MAVRSLGAKHCAARRWTNRGPQPPASLAAALGLPDEDEVPVPAPPTTPAVGESSHAHAHQRLFWAHDDDEERDTLIDAICLSEDTLRVELR
jgi:hypothetical protein